MYANRHSTRLCCVLHSRIGTNIACIYFENTLFACFICKAQENYCVCRTQTPAIIETLIITLIGCAAYYEAACARLGHDPLREDADGEALWEIVHNSKKSIGAILMDQTIIAGVGNIFRAEILFKVPSSRLADARRACM